MTFTYFMRETYDELGEVYVDLMRADRSINREEPLYQSFTAYAIAMLVVYPIGVPLLYALMFHRSRHQLHEMRRIELTLETDFALAKLEAEAAATPEETDEMVRRAIEVHKASGEALENLRGELPTTLRKLTAGYELRTYWFEIFECLRKITLIGLPIFFPPGSPPQLIFGLIICFLSYGAYCVYSPYVAADDDFLAQVAQVIIFFSLVSSVVTNAFPEDPLMKVLLPALLAVPVILTFIFETPLLEFLRSFTEPDKEGNVGLAGQFILAFRRHTLRITDRLVGVVGQEEAKSETRAVWEEHSKELGASALVRVRSSQSVSMPEPSASPAEGPAEGPEQEVQLEPEQPESLESLESLEQDVQLVQQELQKPLVQPAQLKLLEQLVPQEPQAQQEQPTPRTFLFGARSRSSVSPM
jgi:hypothetical protein